MIEHRHLCPDPGVGCGAFAQTARGRTGAASPGELLEHWGSLSKDPVLAGPGTDREPPLPRFQRRYPQQCRPRSPPHSKKTNVRPRIDMK
ncbi:hypothetical protein DV515_00012403 [Chloebia gouldiae]|uniref:Uncharacterized protein n=1 Tax=Chloebia gouldiae TaxID=44316 RepID=A0A3L8S3M6_CHLGU|nr:hypothetical protein DV515_00012403 [Chloebia gouldiae]